MPFLYPTSRKFPVDEVCERIVRELEKRDWKVPDINVKFYSYGSFQKVDTISGPNFKLWFCRAQRQLNLQYNDTAAVTELVIPQKELHIFEDESGPTYNIYVGKDWESDKEWFISSSKVNTKLNKQPRRHLHYSGSASTTKRYTYQYTRPTYLVHDNDLGREFDLKIGDPKYFVTQDVMLEFKYWLEENVVAYILAQTLVTK